MDFSSYERFEKLACQDLYSWRLKQIHGVHVFDKVGFPGKMESLDDLKWILDTMQENRLEGFTQEVGGWTEEDIAALREVVSLYGEFFVHTFSASKAIIPVSTLLAHYVLSRKLSRYVKHVGLKAPRILEIGPGCGYSSFFFRQWPQLGHYAQIEAAPSFYILQHWINKFLFGARFVECANPEHGASSYSAAAPFVDQLDGIESPSFVDLKQPTMCSHYPWWKIGDVRMYKFDIFISNANLIEFSYEAFTQYAQLAYNVLDDQGIFFAQCLGGLHDPSQSYSYVLGRIFGYLYSIGFAPLMVKLGPDANETNTPFTSRWATSPLSKQYFCLSNTLLIKHTHPLYNQLKSEEIAFPVCPNIAVTREMFAPNDCTTARSYSKQELVKAIAPVHGRVLI